MKIAVATDDQVNVTGHVGRCKGFIVFEVEDGKIISREVRQNGFTNHAKGDHQHHDHQSHEHEHAHNHSHESLAKGLSDCSHLVSHGMGMRLVNDMKANNIMPIITDVVNAEEAVLLLEKGELVSYENKACQH